LQGSFLLVNASSQQDHVNGEGLPWQSASPLELHFWDQVKPLPAPSMRHGFYPYHGDVGILQPKGVNVRKGRVKRVRRVHTDTPIYIGVRIILLPYPDLAA